MSDGLEDAIGINLKIFGGQVGNLAALGIGDDRIDLNESGTYTEDRIRAVCHALGEGGNGQEGSEDNDGFKS